MPLRNDTVALDRGQAPRPKVLGPPLNPFRPLTKRDRKRDGHAELDSMDRGRRGLDEGWRWGQKEKKAKKKFEKKEKERTNLDHSKNTRMEEVSTF